MLRLIPRPFQRLFIATTLFTATTLLAGSSTIRAQDIFSNLITGKNPSNKNPYTKDQFVVKNLTASGIGRGTGIVGVDTDDGYNASGWNTSSLDTTAYFNWKMTPDSGYAIDLSALTYTGQTALEGPTNFAFRSGTDNFVGNIGTPTATGTTLTTTGAAFQNIQSEIEFRLYGWGATSADGTFSINDFTFSGLVSNRWDGDTNGNIDQRRNYVSGNAPIAANGIQFEGSLNTNVNVNVATTVAGLRFASDAAAFTIGGTNTLTVGAGGIANYSANTQTITAPLALSASQTINAANAGIVINGTVSGAFAMNKSGTSTLTLTGSNSYSGGTTLALGSLFANNTSGSATGTGNVTVGSGATLGGTGIIRPSNGNGVTIQSGGILRAGDASGVGTLTVGGALANNSVAFNAGSTMGLRLTAEGSSSAAGTGGSSTGSNNNRLTVLGTGALSFDNNTNFAINAFGSTFLNTNTYSYLIATSPNSQTGLNITNQSQFTTTNFSNANDFLFSVTGDASGQVFLNISPVPEPAAVLGISATALMVGGLVRRRWRRGPSETEPATGSLGEQGV